MNCVLSRLRLRLRCWLAPAALSVLAGCATVPPPLYAWNGYQRELYAYLKGDVSGPGEQLAALQAQAEKARARSATLPPGFRAQLALLHLQLGRFDEARQMIEEEKAAFPESTQYMDFVLEGMGSRNGS